MGRGGDGDLARDGRKETERDVMAVGVGEW